MKTQTITKNDIRTLLETIPSGQFFTVRFRKANGEDRTMNCRTGVKSRLTPNPKREAPVMPQNIVTVFDAQADNYRNFNIETTQSITACGTVFEVR